MDSAKDNDRNPYGHVHTDKLEKLAHEVNTDGNKANCISSSTEHVYSC